MNLNVVKTCRFCGSNKITKAISLGKKYLHGHLQTVIIIKKRYIQPSLKNFYFTSFEKKFFKYIKYN